MRFPERNSSKVPRPAIAPGSGPRLRPRWAEWARAFKERHRWISRLPSSPAMILRRTQAGSFFVDARRSAATFLAQPESHAHWNPMFISRPALRELRTTERIAHRWSAPPIARVSLALAPMRQLVPRRVDSPSPANVWYRQPVRAIAVSAMPGSAPPRLQHRAAGAIIERSTRHVRHHEEFVRVFGTPARVLAEPPQTARRVALRNARHEGPRPPAPMVARSTQPAARPAAEQHVEEPKWRERPASAPPPAPPAINLDALTSQVMDQIDRRVIAWRERMGRF